jgi:hypothetical protein
MIQSPPRRVFRQTVALRLAVGLLFLMIAGMFLAAGLGSDPVDSRGVAIGVAVLAAYAGLWVAVGRTTLAVFHEGLRWSSVLGTRELLWSDIAEYRYRIIPLQSGGGLLGALIGAVMRAAARLGNWNTHSLKLTLTGLRRRDIKVTSNFESADQAIEMILREIHDRLKPELKRRLANGDEVAFGPLKLSLRGVAWKGREPIPPAEIVKAEISGRKLRVRRQGKMLDTVGVAADKIPNVLLALELIEELRVNAGLNGVAATFA